MLAIVSSATKLKVSGLDHFDKTVRQCIECLTAERLRQFERQLKAFFAELAESVFFSQAFLHLKRISFERLALLQTSALTARCSLFYGRVRLPATF